MAKVVKKNIRPVKKVFASPFQIYWTKNNYYLLILGIAFIIIGFYLMSIGNWNSTVSLVVSPIVLVIGYLLIIPASIFYREKKEKVKEP